MNVELVRVAAMRRYGVDDEKQALLMATQDLWPILRPGEPRTITNWLNGTTKKVPHSALPAIAKVLGVTPHELLGWDGPCSEAAARSDAAASVPDSAS